MQETEGRRLLAQILEEKRERLGLNKRDMSEYLGIPYGTYQNYSNPDSGYTLQPDTVAQIAGVLGYTEVEMFKLAYGLEGEEPAIASEILYIQDVYDRLNGNERNILLRLVRAFVQDSETESEQITRGRIVAKELPQLEISAFQSVGRYIQDFAILFFKGSKDEQMAKLIQDSIQRVGLERPSLEQIEKILDSLACRTVLDILSPMKSLSYPEKLMYLTVYFGEQEPPWDKREDVIARWNGLLNLVE